MRTSLFVSIGMILLEGLLVSPIMADDTLVRFRGGIGAVPISNVLVDAATGAITVNRNIVRGVNSPGQIWAIRELEAKIKTDGNIEVEGKGLILAGGNNAGRATGQRVFATLICEAAAPFTEHSTNPAGVPLAPNGDFKIEDVLTTVPPADCASPMLLIRTAGSGNWFAAGILETGNEED